MNFKLKNADTILNTILGDIDWLDIAFYMQKQNDSNLSISGTSNLLLCFNPAMLDILYKFDQ